MKKLIILLFGILPGCVTYEGYEIEKAQALCKDHKGIYQMYVEFGLTNLICNDGKFIFEIKYKEL